MKIQCKKLIVIKIVFIKFLGQEIVNVIHIIKQQNKATSTEPLYGQDYERCQHKNLHSSIGF